MNVPLLNAPNQLRVGRELLTIAEERLAKIEREILLKRLPYETYLEKRGAAEELRAAIKAMDTHLGQKERES